MSAGPRTGGFHYSPFGHGRANAPRKTLQLTLRFREVAWSGSSGWRRLGHGSAAWWTRFPQEANRSTLTKRGRRRAILVSSDEYARLKQAATREAREELGKRLMAVRRAVTAAGLDSSVVDQAVAAARRLP